MTEEVKMLPSFKIKDQASWNKGLANNTDDYGGEIYRYAACWAHFMERDMALGKSLADCAEPTSHEADNNGGITGFMYGAAVSVLSQVWEHGEELRRWHNLNTQIRDEGEKANKTGGVLNPALMNIETK